jgi:nucleotide-binding universal stress UspA family protein
MPAMRTTCLLLGIGLSAFGCATSTGPFAATAVTKSSPAPAVKADIDAKVSSWKTVVYANRRPNADVIFYGLADWRDAIDGAKTAGAKATVHVLDGDASTALMDFCKKNGADLLVVGAHGMTGAGRFLLGSVPNRCSHHAPCSVLIAR